MLMRLPIFVAVLAVWEVEGKKPAYNLEQTVKVKLQKGAGGAVLLVGDATTELPGSVAPKADAEAATVGMHAELAAEVAVRADAMLQVKFSGVKKRQAEPEFCNHQSDSVWTSVCNHWSSLVANDIVHNGGSVCCSAVPEACRGSACSDGSECWTPSCDQESSYLDLVEFTAVATLEDSSIDPRKCFFETARQACSSIDASTVSVDLHRLHDFVVSADFNSSLPESWSGTSLLQAERQPWHAEHVDRLEWRVEDSHSPYDMLGVEHSFLVAAANGKQYRLEQADPYDVVLLTSDTSSGRLHDAATSSDLRPGLTVGDLVGQFPGGHPWDVLTQNCHHLAKAVFLHAAPQVDEPSLPNPKWHAALSAASALAPAAFTQHGVQSFKSAVESIHQSTHPSKP